MALAEVEPGLESVSWRLNEEGLAKFSIPYADAKCTPTNLQYGNRVLIQFDSGLPDWGGVIDPPRSRDPTGVAVTAYTGERILAWRNTPKSAMYPGYAPGAIYKALIEEENSESPTGIAPGIIYTGGPPRTSEFHYHDVLQRIKELARDSGEDFAILPQYGGGVLAFLARWYERRGSDKSQTVLLVEDKNVTDVKLDEQGQIANQVTMIGAGQTWGDERLTSTEVDADSEALYGFREYSRVLSGVTHQGTLDANAEANLDDLKHPRSRLTLAASNAAPSTFDEYDVGDIVRVQAFFKGGSNWVTDAAWRIRAREWQPDGACRLEVEEWR